MKTSVFDLDKIGHCFDKIVKRTGEKQGGVGFFSTTEPSPSTTYEVHFKIHAGYDANNSNHQRTLTSWLQDKIHRAEIKFTELQHTISDEIHSICEQNNKIHLQFHPALSPEEEASLMDSKPEPFYNEKACEKLFASECNITIPFCTIS